MLPKMCRRPGFPLIPFFGAICIATLFHVMPAKADDNSILGALPGNQISPVVSVGANGGWLVWEDGSIKGIGRGWGIGARRLGVDGVPVSSNLVVNSVRLGDQNAPQVAVADDGSAAFVWQGGVKAGTENIYLRTANSFGKLLGTDIIVNTNRKWPKSAPAVALHSNQVTVVWQSYLQDGSFWGVYGQRFLTAPLRRVGAEFRVNQVTNFNQKTPAVASFGDGGTVVAWISEEQRVSLRSSGQVSVDVYARLFDAKGLPAGDEFCVNADSSFCAGPTIAVLPDGRFMVCWTGRAILPDADDWDIYGRIFSRTGTPLGGAFRINAYTAGAQYRPKVAADASNFLVVWNSFDQDGSREGCYGRSVDADGVFVSDEFRLNTTTIGRQMDPAVTSLPAGGFFEIWSGFIRTTWFDLFTQQIP